MYDLLSEDTLTDNLYFVRLRYINNVKDAINNPLEAIRKYIAKDAFKSDKPISLEDLNDAILIILILDGLDELYMHQGLTNTDIKNLVTGLSNELKNHKNLKILLTTRYNYLNIDELSGEKYLVLKLDELSENQQLEWLEKYKAIYPSCNLDADLIKTINEGEDPKYDGIKELINQPILIQMIARSGLDVTQSSNRAKIYETLFNNIINRKWSREGQLEKYGQLTEKDLRGFLQTIALTIYQSDFDYVRKNEFESHELLKKAKNRFLKKTDNQLPLDDALKEILVSFYFKNKQKSTEDREDKDRQNDYAIEFLHKSLQEYLVAEKVWHFFKTFFMRKYEDDEYIIDDWKKVLEGIHPITSPKILSREITDYLIEIIENESNETIKDELAIRLDSFLPALIKRDFLYQFDINKEYEPFDKGLSNFYTYWEILSRLRENNIIEKKSHSRFIFLLSSLQNLAHGLRINLSKVNLNGVNLNGVNLNGADLRRADLRRADLKRADLKRADLRGADLRGTDLRGADLRGAHLSDADLSDADLSGANLEEAHLRRVDLRGTDLRGADLKKADLRGADLRGADLRRIDLRETDLSGANLSEANLRRVYLKRTDLSGAVGLNTAIGLESN